MSALVPEAHNVYEEWTIAIAILAAAVVIAAFVRFILRSRRKGKYGPLLSELAAPVANFILVVGANAFAQLAPLKPKLALWLGDGVYVVGVVIITFLLRRAILLSVDWGARRSPRGGAL